MRTALIGGASQGLGLGCAKALAASGHRVIMCARNEERLEEAARILRRSSPEEVIAIPCDFSRQESLRALAEKLAVHSIDVDIIVNNVGGPRPGMATELTEQDWEDGLDLLFRSTIRLYAMFLPSMRQRKWGRIINILSTTALEPVPSLAVSSVLRAGLASYAKLIAWEVAKDGITVNSIMPGGFLTSRTMALEKDAAARENVPEEVIRQRIENNLPLHRMLDPLELGTFVAYLSSEHSGGLTGLLVPIDGGQMKSI
jgi:3-oxoacyl-[acyl-carrier protein] reductase